MKVSSVNRRAFIIHLIVDILFWRSPRIQDGVVVAMIDNHDTPWFEHVGKVCQSCTMTTLRPVKIG